MTFFSNLDIILIAELMKATKTIRAAVAWCTDVNIIRTLAMIQQRGISVELIVNDDKTSRGVDYSPLVSNGANVIFVDKASNIMLHKFCIIDNTTLITGSYNWTKHAASNDEQLSVDNDSVEISVFQERYDSIKFFNEKPIEKKHSKQKNNSIIFKIEEKVHRINRTFTILPENDERLSLAAQKLGVTKSYIIEKLFESWWDKYSKTSNQ